MKLFQRFFSPKWKNKDPDIRKQALIALNRDDNQAVFSEIADQDKVSELRQLAVKRINSLDTLISIATNNSDDKVQALANKIISQILAGSDEYKNLLSPQERIDKINSLNSHVEGQLTEHSSEIQKILELIAEKGDTTEIRIAAIAHVNREALLGNILIKEPDAKIKNKIAEKISQKSTLERVLKSIKNKDKQTSKVIKAKLDQLIAKEEEPKVFLAKQKTLCQNIEQLGKKGLWERDKLQFDHIKTQWNELITSLKSSDQDLALDQKLENRFTIASQLFQDHYNNYLSRNEARLKQEAELLPLKEEKEGLIAQLNQLLLDANEQTFHDNFQELVTQFSAAQQQWQTIKSLPDDIEQDYNKQYHHVCNSLKTYIKKIESETKANSTLNSLLADVKYALKQNHKLTQTKVNHLEKKLNSISSAPTNKTTPLIAEIKTLIEKAKSIIEKNKIKSSELFSHTQSFINVLQTALDEGEIKTANDTQKTIQANIKKLEKIGHSRLADLKQQDLTLSSKLAELNKWRSWANTPQKERLISEMEALINSDLDPKEIAFLVSKARKEWQRLGPSDRNSSQAMWEKFSTACDAAYEPCKSVFEDEAKTRAENYIKRVAFLENLESFVNNANWEEVNWIKVENLYQQARREWQDLGTVDKNKRKPINSRFNKAHVILKEKLAIEWDNNKMRKQEIVEQSQALVELEDLNKAINSAKELQKKWKNAGRIQRHLENKLWGEFRENCDKIFARRESANKQKKDEEKELNSKIETLCSELEALCGKPEKEIIHNSESIFSLQKQITKLTSSGEKQDKSITARINQSLIIFEVKKSTAIRINQISSLISLKEKVTFLQGIENTGSSNSSKTWEETTNEFNAINSSSNPDWENIINDRFSALRNIDDPKLIFENSDTNLATIKKSTILLEIIAEVNTPDEDSAERLKIQTERLNKKLNDHNDEDQWSAFINTEANWLLNGPIAEPELKPFKDRHYNIIKELKQQYAIELEDY